MANQVNVTLTARSFQDASALALSIAEKFDAEFSIPANTTDMEIALTGISTPKLLYVKGARGVSVRLAALGTSIPCNTFFLMTNVDAPQALASILVSNSDTQAHDIVVLAAE
jgi:hypothetical protein